MDDQERQATADEVRRVRVQLMGRLDSLEARIRQKALQAEAEARSRRKTPKR